MRKNDALVCRRTDKCFITCKWLLNLCAPMAAKPPSTELRGFKSSKRRLKGALRGGNSMSNSRWHVRVAVSLDHASLLALLAKGIWRLCGFWVPWSHVDSGWHCLFAQPFSVFVCPCSLVSVIRGQVLTGDGTPLIGVNVSFLHYPEYGYTITRQDGM